MGKREGKNGLRAVFVESDARLVGAVAVTAEGTSVLLVLNFNLS